MARYFGVHFADDDQMDRYHELREVHPNLRAALEYALELDDETAEADEAGHLAGHGGRGLRFGGHLGSAEERWRSGADLACSLYGYWQISGLLGEGGYWLTKVLDRFPEPGPERARALVNRGFLRSFHGRHRQRARRLRGRDRDGARARRRRRGGPRLPAHDAHAHLPRPGTTRRLKVAEEARARLRACGDLAGELMLMAQLGHLHQLAGRPAESVAVCEEGLAMLGADTREQWISTYLHAVSGFALFQMPGREADCEAVLRKSLHGKQELGDVIGMAYALDVLGWLSVEDGLAGAGRLAARRGGPAVGARRQPAVQRDRDHGGVPPAGGSVRRAEALGEAAYAAEYAAGDRLRAGAARRRGRRRARCGWRFPSSFRGGRSKPNPFGMILVGIQGV